MCHAWKQQSPMEYFKNQVSLDKLGGEMWPSFGSMVLKPLAISFALVAHLMTWVLLAWQARQPYVCMHVMLHVSKKNK